MKKQFATGIMFGVLAVGLTAFVAMAGTSTTKAGRGACEMKAQTAQMGGHCSDEAIKASGGCSDEAMKASGCGSEMDKTAHASGNTAECPYMQAQAKSEASSGCCSSSGKTTAAPGAKSSI